MVEGELGLVKQRLLERTLRETMTAKYGRVGVLHHSANKIKSLRCGEVVWKVWKR